MLKLFGLICLALVVSLNCVHNTQLCHGELSLQSTVLLVAKFSVISLKFLFPVISHFVLLASTNADEYSKIFSDTMNCHFCGRQYHVRAVSFDHYC